MRESVVTEQMEEMKKRIDELTEILNRASKAYYDDASEIMTNYEYDAMYDELLELEEKTGYVPAESPSQNVGYTVQSELPKERHAKRMLSLDKTKDREELRNWLDGHDALLSWKLDGLTVVLTYENGKLEKAVTRGNGDVGEVITPNARVFVNVPKRIPYKGHTVVRGEAVIRYDDFEQINEKIDDADAKYKNPRNLCSGSVRQLDSRVTAERNVRFYAFTLSEAPDVDFDASREKQMQWMTAQGFDVVEYRKVDGNNLLQAIDAFESRIPTFEIPSDGLVLTLEDLVYSDSLGTTAKFPKDSIAFKWRDQTAETVLREIEWSPSRTGLLNPVAIFDPVELEGTTVSRASVHNINTVEDLHLGIGDHITVYKANMIIPQVSGNLTESGNLEIPKVCPVCGGKTSIRADAGTKVLTCINPDCLAKQVKRFCLFVSRDAMNIEGLSEQTILKLIGKGFIRSFPDIFELETHQEDIKQMDGFGEKSCMRLLESIENARNTTPARVLTALGIPGIGVTMANQIARASGNNWKTICNLTEDDLRNIDGVGSVMSRDYVAFFNDAENAVMIERLHKCLNLNESFEERGTGLSGKVFVITGSLEHYSNRKELKQAIESEGGKVAGSVSGSTNYLITNNPNSGSSKNKAAREMGVEIITEEDIIRLLENAGGTPQGN